MTNVLTRYVVALLAVILTGFLFTELREVLEPLLYAIILSATLLPYIKVLARWRVPESVAIMVSLLLLYCIVFFISWWIYDSLSIFQEDYPILQQKAVEWMNYADTLLKGGGIEGYAILKSKMNEILLKGSEVMGYVLVLLSGLAEELVLATIYSLLLLTYRKNLYLAVEGVMGDGRQADTFSFFNAITNTLSRYIVGLIKVQGIVFLMLWGLLGVSGVNHSLFFAFLGAFLNVIPYLGIFSVGIATSVYSFLIYSDWRFMIWVLVIFWLVHFIEANFVTPKLLGKTMNLNALAIIFFVILGGHFWGLSGMILALPFTATLRIILEHSRSLKNWALFLKG